MQETQNLTQIPAGMRVFLSRPQDPHRNSGIVIRAGECFPYGELGYYIRYANGRHEMVAASQLSLFGVEFLDEERGRFNRFSFIDQERDLPGVGEIVLLDMDPYVFTGMVVATQRTHRWLDGEDAVLIYTEANCESNDRWWFEAHQVWSTGITLEQYCLRGGDTRQGVPSVEELVDQLDPQDLPLQVLDIVTSDPLL